METQTMTVYTDLAGKTVTKYEPRILYSGFPPVSNVRKLNVYGMISEDNATGRYTYEVLAENEGFRSPDPITSVLVLVAKSDLYSNHDDAECDLGMVLSGMQEMSDRAESSLGLFPEWQRKVRNSRLS
jgi:hypothetical protein